MTKVHWPPMNKFVCKLHGYIVYVPVNMVLQYHNLDVTQWLHFFTKSIGIHKHER